MENIKFVKVNSSNVQEVGHDGTNLYVKYKSGTYVYENVDKSIYIGNYNNKLTISLADSTNLPSTMTKQEVSDYLKGKVLYYELATTSTSDVSPFAENIEVDDYGTMEFVCNTGVPQGNKFFYPADYVKLIDDLNTYTNGDVTSLAKIANVQSEASSRENNDNILKDAIGGTLRQCLCVKESLNFDNTDFVDLGELNWVYDSQRLYFYTSLVNSGNGKILCTKYKNGNYNDISENNNVIHLSNANYLYVKDSSYTDTTAFKNAMNGVLLAYEKA